MTKLTFKSLAVVFVAATLVSGCALKKMKKKEKTLSYEVQPEVMEVNGDSISMVIKGVIPKKYFNKRAVTELKPVIVTASGETPLEPYKLKGEKVPGDGTTMNKKTGGEFSFSEKVAYTPEMKNSELFMDISAKRKKKTLEFTRVKLADGAITTSLTLKPTEETMLAKDNYVKVVPVNASTTLYYKIDNSDINNSEVKAKNAEAMKMIEDFVKAGNNMTGISISSFASPDGELKRNSKLAEDRTSSSYTAIKATFKKLNIAQVNDSSFYKESATAEDWDGLKQAISASDFSDRDQIVKIVNTVSDVDEREKEIKKLASYKKLAADFLPKLRRSEISLLATEMRKSDAEILNLATTDASKLTAEELMYASTLTEDKAVKASIYNSFMTAYPNDWRGYCNVAGVMLEKGNTEEAVKLLEKANSLSKNNATVYNNLGVAFKHQNKYKDAEQYYLLAKSFGANESINLGNIKVKQGDYTSALAYYGSANGCTYNSALANCLSGNYDAAVRNIDCSKQDASAFYLKAIVGARSANLDMLTTNLTRAIKEDASYRAIAAKDLEFKKYFETDAFKVAVR